MGAVKQILTIDGGGGLDGVFAAAIIQEMESATGKPVQVLFDCFYGTSAGAIPAAALARGTSAGELKDFYIKEGAEVFEKLRRHGLPTASALGKRERTLEITTRTS
jgi:patatin-like phospholipase/acyl hydrolase